MNSLVLLGRILYTSVFLFTIPGLFQEGTVRFAAGLGVPVAPITVPLSGIVLIMGAVSILIGYKAREGALLIVLFLAPVTLTVHKFWTEADPALAAADQGQFMKNLSLLGAALLIAYFGSGPLSLENWTKRRSRERQGTKMIDLTSKRW